MKHSLNRVAAVSALALSITLPQAAHAALTITAAGSTDGFSLLTVTTLPQAGPYGAWGSAILSNGDLVVNGYSPTNSGQTVNFVFKDLDNQTYGAALGYSPWNDGSYASALARVGTTVYGTEYGNNVTRIVNSDGSEGAIISNVGRGGLGGDTPRDSLLVATDSGIQEIDLSNPNPNTNHRVVTTAYADGVTVSSDGKTVYGEVSGYIQGWDIASGNLVYTSPSLGGADGVGIITSGALSGDLVVNNNYGIVELVNPTTNVVTTIADSGSRGDYVGFDVSNGTLFLSQSDRLMRLSLQGGAIGGGGGTGVPEPTSWIMMIVGFAGLGALLRTRRSATPTKA